MGLCRNLGAYQSPAKSSKMFYEKPFIVLPIPPNYIYSISVSFRHF
jgi:hypothetical protein